MNKNLPNQPLKGILDPGMAIAETQDITAEWSPYLEELRNYASHLLGRCEKSLKGVNGTPASLIHLYYHMIQMADGILVLCANACFSAAVPLLRSLWEGALSIQYMLEADFEDRSTAWLICAYLESRERWESQDPASDKWAEIQTMKQNDKYLGTCDFGEKDHSKVQAMIEQFDMMLNKPKFASVFTKLTKDARKRGKWYSVNKGPTTLKKLAEDLNRPLEYEYLYAQFSSVSHAKDATRMIAAHEGIPHFEPIRSDSESVTVYTLTCAYLVGATRMVAEKLRPSEDIRPALRDIMKRHPRSSV